LKNADLAGVSPDERQDLQPSISSRYLSNVFQSEKSHSEVSRLIKQGSVEIDGIKIRDPKVKNRLHPGQNFGLTKRHSLRRIAPDRNWVTRVAIRTGTFTVEAHNLARVKGDFYFGIANFDSINFHASLLDQSRDFAVRFL